MPVNECGLCLSGKRDTFAAIILNGAETTVHHEIYFECFFCVLTRKDLTKCFNDEGTWSCFDSHPSISLFLSQAYFTLMYLLCLFSLYLCVYFCNTFIYLYSCEFLYVPRYALFRIYYLAFNGLTSSVG